MMKKIFLVIMMLFALVAPMALSSCSGINSMSDIDAWIQEYLENQKDSDEEDAGTALPVVLRLTYPAGRSPNVFTTGWSFGASCTDADGNDYSDSVSWSGSGSFEPSTGSLSWPSFNDEGGNKITLTATVGGKTYTKSYTVSCVSPAGYACVSMRAFCPADAHGTPADPLPVIGPITTGSSHVKVNGLSAARVGDVGVHAACGGPNTFTITSGASNVLIDGKAAAKIGSVTHHCGGVGHIVGWEKSK
jgi:uncharacterized Zn-binding protein involved in type VI secretion